MTLDPPSMDGEDLLEEAMDSIGELREKPVQTESIDRDSSPSSDVPLAAEGDISATAIAPNNSQPQSSLGNAEDLVDDSVGIIPQAEPLPAKEFRPWHKPRKQYLREVQWCETISALVDELNLRGQGRPLGYLSLPGDELLDVRAVHHHCQAKGVLLRFLGYNAIAEEPARVTESRLSEAEVKSLPNIYAPSSGVRHDALEDIAIVSSMAHKEARQHAPYDVINIDLCGGVANSKPQTRRSTLQALRGLLEIQLSTAGSTWLLFLTTRIGRTLLDEDAQTLLHGRVSQNTSEAAFCNAIQQKLGFTKQNVKDEEGKVELLPDHLLQKCLSLGICKWLLGLVLGANLGWRITLLPSYSYRIGPKHPHDMVSFGFRVERNPAPLHDPSELTFAVAPIPPPMTEPQLAIAFVDEVAKITDLDAKLLADKALFNRMVDSHGELLSQARYEKEKYIQWVEGGCRR